MADFRDNFLAYIRDVRALYASEKYLYCLIFWYAMVFHLYSEWFLPAPYSSVKFNSELPNQYSDMIDKMAPATAHAAVLYSQSNSAKLSHFDHSTITKYFVGDIIGAESVALKECNGVSELVMLDKFGYLRTAKEKSKQTCSDDSMTCLANETKTETGYELTNFKLYIGPGRPLGFHQLVSDSEGCENIVVCDSVKGLLLVDTSSRLDQGDGDRVRVLSNSVTRDKTAVTYANDLDIGSNGSTIYFSSSTKHGLVSLDANSHTYYDTMRSFLLTWLSGDISGSVLIYDFRTKTTKRLLDGLYYANGVALSSDEDYLLVVETARFRVLKVFLSGKRKGKSEVFIDELPGFPDGIQRSRDGSSFFVSLVVPLSPIVKGSKYPTMRWVLAWLLVDQPFQSILSLGLNQWLGKFGCVIRVSATGIVEEMFLDEEGSHVTTVSAVTEQADGRLLLGNLGGNYISEYKPWKG